MKATCQAYEELRPLWAVIPVSKKLWPAALFFPIALGIHFL
jgi:hypothetical protein